jgi:predicted NBD/HSP70 family sugar kinase
MTKRFGMNNQNLKYKNRGLLLKLICTCEEPSRIYLSQITGLTKMAVTNIITELMDQGYVTESAASRNSSVGRNPITLVPAPTAPKILGIHLSRDGCTAGLFDLKLRVLAEETESFHGETQESVFEKLFRVTDGLFAKEKNILGCGVSVIGPLDAASGTVLNPPNFFGIKNLPLAQLLRERYHLKVMVNNDMNCAALAEKLYGAGKLFHNFLYVGISNGIGSGMITEDMLYQNSSGFVGELGHISIDYHGEACGCGRLGCLECYISTPVILERLQKATGWELSFQEFCQKADDLRVDGILTDMVLKLSYALVNQVNMLNPQAIFIGHEGTFLPDCYLDLLRNEVNQKKFSPTYLKVQVEKSPFGFYAPLYGSVCIVLDRLFESGKLEKEAWT